MQPSFAFQSHRPLLCGDASRRQEKEPRAPSSPSGFPRLLGNHSSAVGSGTHVCFGGMAIMPAPVQMNCHPIGLVELLQESVRAREIDRHCIAGPRTDTPWMAFVQVAPWHFPWPVLGKPLTKANWNLEATPRGKIQVTAVTGSTT